MAQYCARVDTIHDAYLVNRARYYAQETRWSGQPFWQRRQNRDEGTA
jgi:hypothetical protein